MLVSLFLTKINFTEDKNFDINEYVMDLRDKKIKWRQIYWKLWAMTKIWKWKLWNQYVRLRDFDKCRYQFQNFSIGMYHPANPSFLSSKFNPKFYCKTSNFILFQGSYPWCGKIAYKFNTEFENDATGWWFKNHTFEFDASFQETYEWFLKKKDIIFSSYSVYKSIKSQENLRSKNLLETQENQYQYEDEKSDFISKNSLNHWNVRLRKFDSCRNVLKVIIQNMLKWSIITQS